MIIKEHNQNIKSGLTNNLASSKQKFQEITKDINPLFVKAVNQLLQLDFTKLKNETLAELLQSCEKWLNDVDYTNTPMDALVFEYHDMYSAYAVEALAYGIDGDLDTFDIEFINGIEAHDGITIHPFSHLSFVEDDMNLMDESGFDETRAVFLNFVYVLLCEVFEAFVASDIFKKISRKPVFFLAIQEHDLDEQKLFYVFENETVFVDFLEKEAAKKLAEEAEQQEITYHYDLRWHLDGLIDDLIIDDDTSKMEEILSGLNELMTQSEYNRWAELKLGSLYLSGKGVPQDFIKARLLFENVIEYGDKYKKRQAYTSLAVVYFSGNGVEKDITKALEYLKMAHEIDELSGHFLKLKEHIEAMI